MNDDILSYYRVDNGKIVQELLEGHIKLALKNIDTLEDSKIYRMAKRIDSEVNFKNIVRLAIIFHDSGKAFMRYKRHNYISFIGHEFVSAIIMDKFVREMLEQYECFRTVEYYTACTFAVLYHHHAMNPNFRKLRINGTVYNEDFASKLKIVLYEFLDKDERNGLNKVFNKLDEILNYGYLNEIERTNFQRVTGENKSKVRKISYLALNTLIAVDYLSAREGRSDGTKSNFYNAMEEFYNLYIAHG